jgi:hypothetical protein
MEVDQVPWEDDELDELMLDDDDFLDLDAVSLLVDNLTFRLVNINAPDWYMNPDFKVLFSKRSSFDSIAGSSPLTFAPKLHDILTSSEIPTIAFFKSLPIYSGGKIWAVYVIVMEKPGCLPMIYIGSGSHAVHGVGIRLLQHKPGCSTAARFVLQAFKQGYHISHRGLLCWTPLPTPGLVPRVRARILAVEALFTCLFFAAFAATTDSYFKDLLLWERDTATWKPLCSHLPLAERIEGDIRMTAEELELVAALRKIKRAHYLKAHRAARKEKNPDLYRANERVVKNAWADKNRGRVNKTASKVREKNIASCRFECEVCDISLQSQDALNSHLKSQAHANTEAGIQKNELSQYAINLKTQRAIAKANADHECLLCQKSFYNDWGLTRHKEGKRHLAREAKESTDSI